ncbi:hypothetical protein KGF57_005095 [Candida theae]|uniref:Brl1/Brr6 domain-containing protein n=1 Tax=Candida theae TaxID=1198502 RepID=A0AAD5B9T3_9ASCO|nr:uncharacterized protein KGF57_005095 [Candida theae]KAI5948902.1 hypothetical protein KGF57_005095 [Candida theae]
MSINGNLADHELLLQSLSLEDKSEQKWSTSTFARHLDEEDHDAMDIDDDPMDIDDESVDEKSISDPIQGPDGDTVEDTATGPYTGESNHNLLALLSPTMMGARLAVTHKPKLLIPPSPKSYNGMSTGFPTGVESPHPRRRQSSIDYEFDVSAFPIIKNTSQLALNRNNPSFHTVANSAPFESSSPGRYTNFKDTDYTTNHTVTQHQPQAIHHHHYYMNAVNHQSESELIQRAHVNKLEISKLRNEELQRYWAESRQDSSDLTPRSDYINLPAPWHRDIHPHERIPYIVSSYLHLFINFIISMYFIYLVYYIATTIKSDVNHKIQIQKRTIQSQIDTCRTLFYESKCDNPEYNTLPILRKKCETLALGMNQDPNSIGNLSTINAQIIGLILNSLVEPLGFKFFMFLLWCGIVVFGCNFVFGFVRAKTYYGNQRDMEISSRKNE